MTRLEKIEDLIYKGFKETDERWRETDRLWKETWKETDKRWKETDERWKETDERMERSYRKTQREIENVAKQLGGVTESLRRFSEQTVFPATRRLFSKRGIQLNRLYANMPAHLNGESMETDVIGLGPECAVLIEVKLRLRQIDVKEFLENRLPRFFEFFPSFQRPILYGGVAGMSIDQDVERYAYNHGLFVIGQSGENVRIINDRKFKPRSFAPAKTKRVTKRKAK